MEDLSSGFQDFGIVLNERCLQRINDIQCQHKFSVEDIIDEWVAFSENSHIDEITDAAVDKFESKICGKLQKSSDITTPHQQVQPFMFQSETLHDLVDNDVINAYSMPGSSQPVLKQGQLQPPGFVTPVQSMDTEEVKALSVEPKVATPKNYEQNDLIASVGDGWKTPDCFARNMEIMLSDTWLLSCSDASEYGYMYHANYAKASAINKHLCSIGEHLVSAGANYDEPVSLAIPTQETCVYAGIIVSETAEMKIHPQSCLLMGSREVSQGHVVKLDLSGVNNFSIFSGQVVVVRGVCTGKELVANELITNCPPLHPVREATGTTGFTMMVAAGPFTTNDKLDYEPLNDLLTTVRKERPKVLVLCGPFVDARHPMIQTCENEGIVPSMMLADIMKNVAKICHECQTEVVIIPSQFDLPHHQVYPQPAFGSLKNISDGIHFFPNPCVMSINGVSVAISSADILKHMAGQMCGIPHSKDRMSVIIDHIYTQQSFYPLFPPHESTSVDIEDLYKKAKLPFKPDILLLPSELKPFIKVLHGGMCVNPGVAAKGKSKGTYSLLFCPKDDSLTKEYGTKLSCKILHVQ